MKDVLNQFATDEASVDRSAVVEYLETHTSELPEEYEETYQVLRDLTMPIGFENVGKGYDYANGDTNNQ